MDWAIIGHRRKNMMWHLPKRLPWIAAIGAATIGLFIWTALGQGTARSKPVNRVYRIGWESDPPFQAIGSDRPAHGFGYRIGA
jgi:hypothetical protein